MDTTDMTCDTTAVHREFPGRRWERLDDVVTRTLVPSDRSRFAEYSAGLTDMQKVVAEY